MPLRCRGMSRRTVTGLIAAANALRRGLDAPGGHDAEQQLEALFTTSHRLAVYGTLAPGQPNHHIVAPLGGEWGPGLVEGDLHPFMSNLLYFKDVIAAPRGETPRFS